MLWPGRMSPKRAYALLPWRECSRAGFARQRGHGRRDDDNVTSCSQDTEKGYLRRAEFAENRSEYGTRDTRWRDAGLPSARVL
jgi:hypothetical protein